MRVSCVKLNKTVRVFFSLEKAKGKEKSLGTRMGYELRDHVVWVA
jgi:hypothetical protein